eukprot:c9158_g1_i11.p1 GENE.c9158_g1_i11~~c9158_g1_i11.p1  ORF type:complete len:117 (+),score=12.51 c9158_g1_i11:2-352(+)
MGRTVANTINAKTAREVTFDGGTWRCEWNASVFGSRALRRQYKTPGDRTNTAALGSWERSDIFGAIVVEKRSKSECPRCELKQLLLFARNAHSFIHLFVHSLCGHQQPFVSPSLCT